MVVESRQGMGWTEDEEFTLEENAHIISQSNYKRILPGRSLRAIRSHINHLGLGRQRFNRKGLSYTPVEAGMVLGVTRKQVMGWIGRGLIQCVETVPSLWIKKRGRARFSYSIPWSAIDDFITEYPMLFSLDSFPPRQLHSPTNHRLTLERAHPELWMNSTQAAKLLGSQEHWPRSLARLGTIPARRVGGNWYFLKSDVVRYANRRRPRRAATSLSA